MIMIVDCLDTHGQIPVHSSVPGKWRLFSFVFLGDSPLDYDSVEEQKMSRNKYQPGDNELLYPSDILKPNGLSGLIC